MDPNAPKPPRRERYSGTHPKRFSEKYKERQPERYPETVAKVVESGKTPAGSHRAIMVEEILEILAPKPGETAVDATLGHGGHAQELLKRILPGGKLIGLDADPLELPKTEKRLRSLGFSEESFFAIHTNFAALQNILTGQGMEAVDMVVADLGCSSMQLDDPSRGFSFKQQGPLDLRLNPAKGKPASALLAQLDAKALEKLLLENSDEKYAELIARVIQIHQKQKAITTTRQLTVAVRQALSGLPANVRDNEGDKPVQRTFQALRIAVNDEFGTLDAFLRVLPGVLKPGGRVAILSFHSGEDRRVKKSFETALRSGIFEKVVEDPLRPRREEVFSNPRGASAKLRWAIRKKITP